MVGDFRWLHFLKGGSLADTNFYQNLFPIPVYIRVSLSRFFMFSFLKCTEVKV